MKITTAEERQQELHEHLTIEKFRQWLQKFHGDDFVGQKGDDEKCAVAYYLNEIYYPERNNPESRFYDPDLSVLVTHLEFLSHNGDRNVTILELPLWTKEFIFRHDVGYSPFSMLDNIVNADEALTILEGVEAELDELNPEDYEEQ